MYFHMEQVLRRFRKLGSVLRQGMVGLGPTGELAFPRSRELFETERAVMAYQVMLGPHALHLYP